MVSKTFWWNHCLRFRLKNQWNLVCGNKYSHTSLDLLESRKRCNRVSIDERQREQVVDSAKSIFARYSFVTSLSWTTNLRKNYSFRGQRNFHAQPIKILRKHRRSNCKQILLLKIILENKHKILYYLTFTTCEFD